MPTIALCMIVRDEEAMLAGCLESARGAVDQIVVVDTGSRDDTAAIARRFGAVVIDHPWRNDFSDARNRSLRGTNCDWVLILDADERLTQEAARRLRVAVANADFDCGMLPLHNADAVDCDLDAVARGEGRLTDVAYLPRLLRRTDDLGFTGIIHESVGNWLGTERVAKVVPGIDIVHLGGIATVREQRNKSERNIKLLEAYVASHPNELTPYGYLAHEYLEKGDREQAAEVAERGWPLMANFRPTFDLAALRLASARAWLQVQGGEPEKVFESVDAGERFVGDHPDLIFIRGCAYEQLALTTEEPEEREAKLETAATLYGLALRMADGVFLQKFVQGCTDWAARVRLGTVRMVAGHPQQALEEFDRAAAFKPDNPETKWGRIECLIALGEHKMAMREVKDTLDEHPDGWVLAALIMEAAGGLDSMQRFMARAQGGVSDGFIAPHRRERYHDALMALSIYNGVAGSAPGPMGQLASLMQGRYEAVPGARARAIDWDMVGRLVRHLLLQGRQEPVLALIEPAAEALLPGLEQHVRHTLESFEKR